MIAAAEGGLKATHVLSPKQTQLLLRVSLPWFPGICVFLNKIQVRADLSLYFLVFLAWGGRPVKRQSEGCLDQQ